MAEQIKSPEIRWDLGTAYDLFAALNAVYNPGEFGLRASWAAGVRSRISAEARDLLGLTILHLGVPVPWIYDLHPGKDANSVLSRLEGMRPEEVLPAMAINSRYPESRDPVQLEVLKKGGWDEGDVVKYREMVKEHCPTCSPHDLASIPRWLDCWAKPDAFGKSFIRGLTEFHEGFFRDEERRLAAVLERSLKRARELADRLSAAELFEELSQGIREESHLAQSTLVFVPCYWCTPRIFLAALEPGTQIVLFGARPPEASLIPGDTVPAQLLLSLEALSDPTRLTILRAIAEKPMTQAEIARSLRLRPPTISHHLKSLRIAGLIAFIGTGKDETRYGVRTQQVEQSCAALKDFIQSKNGR